MNTICRIDYSGVKTKAERPIRRLLYQSRQVMTKAAVKWVGGGWILSRAVHASHLYVVGAQSLLFGLS